MAVKRFSNSLISQSGQDKVTNFIAGYSPAVDEMDLIERVVVGSGGTSSITFSNIPQTYQHLHIRILTRQTSGTTGENVRVQLGNGTIDSSSNYTRHYLYAGGSSVAATATTSATYSEVGLSASNGDGASIFGAAVLDIIDYVSTSKNKTLRAFSGIDNNGSGYVAVASGLWISTSAVDQIKLTGSSSGNFSQYSTASLYGVKA